MTIKKQLSDESILDALGGRLAQRRLDLKLTQAAVAEQAGVSKRTVERMEAGATVQLSSFVRVLRALDLVKALDSLIPETGPRPMDLLKRKGKERKRVRSSGQRANQSGKTWTWDEDA